MPKVARLKPFNRRRGQLLRRYVFENFKFQCDRWYVVPDDVAAHLSTVHSQPLYPDDSPLAFDIFDSREEAEAQHLREQEQEQEASVKNPQFVGALSTKDLKRDKVDGDKAKAARKKRAEANLERAKAKGGKEKGDDEPDSDSATEGGPVTATDGESKPADNDPAFE